MGRVLILLPPSEGKTAPARGKPVDLSTLHLPELADAREKMLAELIATSARPDALKVLKASAGLAEVIAANEGLRTAPSAPAEQIYTGVLFDALDAANLDPAARRRMRRRALVFSALFGPITLGDRIPAYRLSGSVSLPQLGSVSSYWRNAIGNRLPSKGLAIDCRSSAYAAMWRPPTERHLPVRVFREADGERTVISHMAKHSRGLVARALCESDADPKQVGDLIAILNDWFATHEVHTATGVRVEVYVELGDHTIDVITT